MANIFFGLIQNWKADRSNEEFKTVLFPFVSNESYFNLFGYKGFIESQLMIAQNKLNEFNKLTDNLQLESFGEITPKNNKVINII